MSKVIKIGIDLGTTNSEIAIKNEQKINLVKNNEKEVFTPSVFGIDEEGNKLVGEKAYQKRFIEGEEKNFKARVKRLMGSKKKFDFPRSDQNFGPEEVSAEILKSLKSDVLRKFQNFDTTAAVITIPAYFNRLQAEATKRAGKKAGFEYVVLLQEPIAASMSYGFRQERDENWLVYDLGGGTFDTALVSSTGGSLSVLSHNGDNYLGGDDFDDLIVDEIIIPEITDRVGVSSDEINLSDKDYLILKNEAKKAKEKLSYSRKSTMRVENIFHEGEEVVFDRDLNRDEFNRLIGSIIKKTIKISQKTIKEGSVDLGSINKIILVGGSTKIPYLQKELENKLGIKVDTSGDPITAVARGACIYGSSKQIPQEFIKKDKNDLDNSYSLELNYDSSTVEDEETIGGRIKSLKTKDKNYFVQIQSESGMYSGPKRKLKEDGTFLETLPIEKNKTNKFLIYLYDEQGNSLDLYPNEFEITHGIASTGTPLPRSIGVSVSKIRKDKMEIGAGMDFLFQKGESLPLKATKQYKTIRSLKRDSDKKGLSIEVYEGESDIPEYNTYVCEVEITGKDLEYNLPKGEDVEVTIEINESSELLLEAYFPAIDLHIQNQEKLRTKRDKMVNVKKVKSDLREEKNKFSSVSNKCTKEEKEEINELLNNINKNIKKADQDEEKAKKSQERLKELKKKISKIETRKDFSKLEKEFHLLISEIKDLINDIGDSSKVNKSELMGDLNKFEEKGKDAVSSQDSELLSRVNRQLFSFKQKVLSSSPIFWAELFRRLANRKINNFTNPSKARQLIRKGKNAQNIDEIKSCVRDLFQLLPMEDQFDMKESLPDITFK